MTLIDLKEESKTKLNQALEKIFEQDDNFTGQISLDIHFK